MSKATTVRNRRIGQAVKSAVESLETRVLMAAGDLDPSYGFDWTTGQSTGWVEQRQWGSAYAFGPNTGLNIDSQWLYDNVKSAYYKWGLLPDEDPLTGFGRLQFTQGSTAIHNITIDSGGKLVTVGSELGRHLRVGQNLNYVITSTTDSSKTAKTNNFEYWDTDFALNRYDYDGVLDYTLRGGLAVPSPNATGDRDWNSISGATPLSTDNVGAAYDHGIAVMVDPTDNSYVVVGTNDSSGNDTRKIVLIRYEPSGVFTTQRMDMGIGGMNWTLNAAAMQPDGSIVVVGSVGTDGSTTGEDWAIWRFTRTLDLDTTFGNGGQVITSFQAYSTDVAMDMVIEPAQIRNAAGKMVTNPDAGKILVIGYEDDATWQSRGVSKMVVARYTASGALDTTYGNGGKLIIDDFGGRNAMGASLVIQPDGKVVVLGVYDATPGLGANWPSSYMEIGAGSYLYRGFDTTVALRLNADGSLDQTAFGARGRQVISDPSMAMVGQRVTLDSAGKVIIAGYRYGFDTSTWEYGSTAFVSRLTSDGRPDLTWGTNATQVIDEFGSTVSTDWFNRVSLAVEDDNKIIVTGNVDITYTVTGGVRGATGSTYMGTEGRIARLLSDNKAPQAELLVKDIVLEDPNIATLDLRVSFVDDTFLDLSSIANSVCVFAPDGTQLPVTMIGSPIGEGPNDGVNYSMATVVFRVEPPAGYWSGGYKNGAYRVELLGDRVKDVDNLAAEARTLGQFSVNIRPLDILPPVATLVSLPTGTVGNNAITIGGKQKLNFTILYTDAGGSRVNAATIDDLDIRVVRQGYYDVAARVVDLSSAANSDQIFVEYEIDAPGGFWDVVDNGTYQINLQDHQISDDFYQANWAIAGEVALLSVSVDPQQDVRPTAKLISASPITTGSTAPEQFIVQYSKSAFSQFPLELSTILGNNSAIRVTASRPDSTGVVYTGLATYVGIAEAGTDYIRVTYEFAAADGTWDRTDNNTYEISVEPQQVCDKDFPVNYVLPGVLGSFDVNIQDTVAPTAEVTLAPSIVDAGPNAYTFQVTYVDNIAVRFSTLGTGDVLVTGPNGFSDYPTVVDISATTNGSPRVVTYSIKVPPGGSWDRAGDNGTYLIHLVGGEVTDTAGNSAVPLTPVPGQPDVIGQFVVDIKPDAVPPTVSVQSAPSVTVKGGTSYILTLTWSDNVAVKASTLGSGNIVIVGPDGTEYPVTYATPSTTLNDGPSLTATYRLVPPGGTWNSWDIGTYQIKVVANQVSDVTIPANFAAAGIVGNFAVNIPMSPVTATLVNVENLAGGDAAMYFSVRFTSLDGITSDTLRQPGLITLAKPGGASMAAVFDQFIIGGNNEVSQTVRFSVQGPGGIWDYRDNGAYTITVATPNAVRTVENGALAGGTIGTANVAISAVMLVGSELVISGTDEADSIELLTEGSNIRAIVNNTTVDTAASVVTRITINASNGNDMIRIRSYLPAAFVRGGDGDDFITGGDANDTIYGNFGNDVIYGGRGDDSILAGLGNDTIYGAEGNDQLYAGDGTDSILGGIGDDYIEGRGKADFIDGEEGNDEIWGGAGNDTIRGGAGDDWIDIGYLSFADSVDAGDGSDTIQHTAGDTNDVLLNWESELLA